jgi:hypothetical protein
VSCPPKPSGCSGGEVYPLDFSATDVPPNLFDMQLHNGTLSHVASEGHCGKGLLRATAIVPQEAGAYAQASFFRTVTGSFSSARLVYTFRGPKPVTDGYADIGCSLVFRAATTPNVRTNIVMTISENLLLLGATIRNADGGLVDGGAGSRVPIDNAVSTVEAGEWRTLDASFVITQTKLTVAGTLDGVPFTTFEAPLLEPAGRVNIECGVMFANYVAATHTIDMDDILVELCP